MLSQKLHRALSAFLSTCSLSNAYSLCSLGRDEALSLFLLYPTLQVSAIHSLLFIFYSFDVDPSPPVLSLSHFRIAYTPTDYRTQAGENLPFRVEALRSFLELVST